MTRNRVLTLACSLLLLAPAAFSQNSGPPDMPPHDMPPHDMSGREMPGRPYRGNLDGLPGHGGSRGMGILPPGAWWRNPDTVKNLGLSSDQQKRMDDIMLQSRLQLIHMKASLEEEQVKLEPLLNANPVDQKASLTQIAKIADLRADLEKANAKTLLGLRGILTADQWTRLQAERHAHREYHGDDMRGPRSGSPASGGPGEE